MAAPADPERPQSNYEYTAAHGHPDERVIKLMQRYFRWEQYADIHGWPTFDGYATTPWNYGLVLDADPAAEFQVTRRPGPVPAPPFTPEDVPLRMTARAKWIPNWQKDRFNLVGLPAQSPVKSDEPTETVTLIPMGADRLRISQFPVIGTGEAAHDWPAPPPAPAYAVSASHCYAGDALDAVCDGIVPAAGSADPSIPRMTFWNHRGTAEWIQYDFPAPKKVGSAEAYWYDDAKTGGHCRPPANWQVQYRDATGQWKPVDDATPAGVADDTFNRTTFTPVATTGLRLAIQLQPDASAGILEWRVAD